MKQQNKGFSVLLASFLAGLVTAANGLAADFEIQKLADGVYAAIAQPGGKAASNSGFIVNDSEVVVVDSHLFPEVARSLLDEIRKVTDKPVRYLAVTHKHRDHVGGTTAFGLGVEIISHENTRAAMAADTAPTFRVPTVTFNRKLAFHRPNRTIELLYSGRGHTDGDIAVWLPEEKILFAGDLYFNGAAGVMRDGFLRDWVATLEELRSLSAKTVVPGHGPVSGKDGLLNFQNYLADFIRAVKVQVDAGQTLEQVLKDFSLPKYKDLAGWDSWLSMNITRCYNELKGEKR
ncbi:MAG: MBL fold metallo-hydrolase [candidate division Zixibacteria bacterium]|nr:MBL fold metallo-hydrolase [candidate division Zixibacteria bacterium]